jgi:beta propeller repeat protein
MASKWIPVGMLLSSVIWVLVSQPDARAQSDFPVCTAAGNQDNPDVCGDIVVWQDARNAGSSGWDIYGYDLESETEFPICTADGDQVAPAVSGSIVVWQDDRNAGSTGWDLYGYDLGGGGEFAVCTSSGDQQSPDVSGDVIVWEDDRGSLVTGWDIYGCDLGGTGDFVVCAEAGDQKAPAVSGACIVWEDARNLATTGWDIYRYDLSAGEESAVCASWGDQYDPSVSGPQWGAYYVAWTDMQNDPGDGSNADIYTWDGYHQVIIAACTYPGNQTQPSVAAGVMYAWTDDRYHPGDTANLDVFAASYPFEGPLSAAAGAQSSSAVYGVYGVAPAVAAWADGRNQGTSGRDIYATYCHVLSGEISVNPSPVVGGSPTQLGGYGFDTATHACVAWSWDDGGAGGQFSPSAHVAAPIYTPPQNLSGREQVAVLTLSLTCDGPDPITSMTTFPFLILPTPPEAGTATAHLPASLAWAETSPASVSVTNDGFGAWSLAGGYALVPDDAYNRWGLTSVPVTSDVPPGGSHTFSFDLTAPPLTTLAYPRPVIPTSTPGTVDSIECAWIMAQDGEPFAEALASSDVVISRFSDIQPELGQQASWARFWIEECAGRVPAVVGGYQDGTYRPHLQVARDAMAVFIARAMKLPTAPYQGLFDDVPGPGDPDEQWAWPWIEALATAGIVQGYSPTEYRPWVLVERDTMAVYVARALVGGLDIPTGPPVGTFDDVPDRDPGPPHWAYDAIEYCVANGVVQGYTATEYRPDNLVDRGQMAVFVWRAFMMPTGVPVVLGGPAVTAVNPQTAIYQGWSSLPSAASSDPGYAYLVFDAVRLDTNLTGPDSFFDITFELRGLVHPSASYTASLTEADITAARNAAIGTGFPHYPVSWDIPSGLPPGDYTLVVKVEDETGAMHEIARQPSFTITP